MSRDGDAAEPAPRDRVAEAISHLALDVAAISDVPDSHSSLVRRLVLRDGTRAVLKIPFTPAKALRECAALRSVGHLPFVARVLAEFTLGDGTAGFLMSHLPGAPLPPAAQLPRELAASVGRALARIHSAAMRRAECEAPDPPWADVLRGRLAEYLPLCRAGVPDAPWDRIAEAIERGVCGLPPTAPRMVHMDFRTGNLLCRGDELAGVVDFESSRNGAPYADFVNLAREWWDPEPRLRDAMLGGYGEVRAVPPDLDRLRPFHELFGSVACVAWSARRGLTETPFCRGHLAIAARALRDLP